MIPVLPTGPSSPPCGGLRLISITRAYTRVKNSVASAHPSKGDKLRAVRKLRRESENSEYASPNVARHSQQRIC